MGTATNCTLNEEYEAFSWYFDTDKLPSPPDISGIGVTIGFVATAYIVVLVLVVYYVVAFQPDLDPFENARRLDSDEIFKPNPIDSVFLGQIRRPFKRWLAFWPRQQECFEKCVLLMSDIQLVTGIAILISGWTTVHYLTVNDWNNLTYIAWFSATTHLAALSFLRKYLQQHPRKLNWRLFFMFLIVIMLVLTLGVGTRHQRLRRLPAVCLFQVPRAWDEYNNTTNMVISASLLLCSLITRTAKLKKTLSIRFVARWRAAGSRKYLMVLDKAYHSSRWGGTYRPFLVGYLFLRLFLDIFSSMLSEIYWLIFTALWGSISLFLARSSDNNNEWNLGQVLPVVLLAAPLMTVFENLSPGTEKQASEEPPAARSLTARSPLNSLQPQSAQRDYYQAKWFQLLHHQVWIAILNFANSLFLLKIYSTAQQIPVLGVLAAASLVQGVVVFVILPIYSLLAMALEEYFLVRGARSKGSEMIAYEFLGLLSCLGQAGFAFRLGRSASDWAFGYVYTCLLVISIVVKGARALKARI